MITYVKKKQAATQAAIAPSAHTKALMDAKAVWNGNSVSFEVANTVHVDGLTQGEIKALRATHKTSTPNFERAKQVKSLMQQGRTRAQITSLLRHKGKGYQSRQVHADYAALSKAGRKA